MGIARWPRRAARLWHISGWPESEADQAARQALGELLGPGPGRLELGTKLGCGWVSFETSL